MTGPAVITAHEQMEGGGFLVHRPFPSMALPDMDPFLLLDEMGPTEPGPREAVGAPDHPHRGFETVTYMLAGKMEHKDSHGNHGVLGPGDVQWMTAGSGVVHSELPEPAFYETGGRMHGIQLWVNLPAKDKMMQPRYQDIPAAKMPEGHTDGGTVRIISGSYQGTGAIIDTIVPIQYLHVRLDGTVPVTIPEGHNGFVYILSGEVITSAGTGTDHQLVRLTPGDHDLTGHADCLVLSGPPLGEPVSRYGPFVMNTREEIYQAVRDFQEGRFGTIDPMMEKELFSKPVKDPSG